MRFKHLALPIATSLVLAACATLPPAPPVATDDWREVAGPEGTLCAFGDPYRWYVRDGTDTDKLMIYFQAGGACWSAETCAQNAPGWSKAISEAELKSYRGMFEFENADNPVTDHTIVFVPYCSGDVHAGATDVEYPSTVGGPTVSIHHRGALNAQAALNWTYANYPAPKEVLVVGSSAGGIGSIYHAANVMQHYKDAQVAQFSDGFVGVMPVGWEPLKIWDIYANLPGFIPALANADPSTFTINAIYTATAQHFPERTFAQFTHAADSFQIGYYALAGGNAADWHKQRDAFLTELSQEPNFRSYVGAGVLHTALAYPEFYTMAVDGVRLRDWFADTIRFKPVDNVHCPRGTVTCP
jgi:hypothetical protein